MSLRTLKDEQHSLVEENMQLVKWVVSRFVDHDSREFDDLVSIGYIGLCKAASSYNPKHGTVFSTFATKCILNELRMEFRSRATAGRGFGDVPISLNQPLDDDDGDDSCELIDMVSDPSVNVESAVLSKMVCEQVANLIPTYTKMQDECLNIADIARMEHKSRQCIHSRVEREFRRARMALSSIR